MTNVLTSTKCQVTSCFQPLKEVFTLGIGFNASLMVSKIDTQISTYPIGMNGA